MNETKSRIGNISLRIQIYLMLIQPDLLDLTIV